MRARRVSGRSGFTLLELAIVMLIISVMMAAVSLFQLTNRKTLQHSAAVGTAQSLAHQALERVLHELDGATVTSFVPDPTSALGSDNLSFQRSTGVDATGNVIWSTRTRIALVMEDGETPNGKDDNKNGLVDERKLVITYDYGSPGARSVTVAHFLPALFPGELPNGADDNGNGVIDEAGLSFQRVGTLLNVRLAVGARGSDGRWESWTESSGLKLRN